MVMLDYYTKLGLAVELLAKTSRHSDCQLGSIIKSKISPPLWKNQIQFYFDNDSSPVAMIIWAKLNEAILKDICLTGRDIHSTEWSGGPHLFFSDCIALNGETDSTIHNAMKVDFPNDLATSIEKDHHNGTIKVHKWTGISAQKDLGF